ncbi:MAG: hypothetical protein RL701_5396, partial [Pseudomonadota bacterium]
TGNGQAGEGAAGESSDDSDAGPAQEAAGSGGMSEPAPGGSGGSGEAGATGAGGMSEAGASGGGGGGGETSEAGAGGAAGSAAGSGGTAPTEPACDATTEPKIPALKLQTLITSAQLDVLTFATQPPNSDDWYLVSQRGRVSILRDGALLPTPFLDLSSEITLGAGFDQTLPGLYDERGLISLAFASDYTTSGLFYVAITPSTPDSALLPSGLQADHDQVLEYRRSADNADQADAAVVRKLFDVPSSPAALGKIHNINTLRFGPDGYLYIGMGDGGGVGCNDAEPNASQDLEKPFGKMLRLDLSQPAPYAAAGNPFADKGGAAPLVFHYGVRNPFRFSFDRANGDLYFGDVGQDRYEEINFAAAGAKGLNFGWATYEGTSSCPSAQRTLNPGSTPTAPIFIADRRGTGPFRDYRAIVGGIVYRGQALPELVGTYVFGDYYGARLGALKRCGAATSPTGIIYKNCDPNFPGACLQTGSPQFTTLTAIVEDHAGELHFVANGNSLLKLVPGE